MKQNELARMEIYFFPNIYARDGLTDTEIKISRQAGKRRQREDYVSVKEITRVFCEK